LLLANIKQMMASEKARRNLGSLLDKILVGLVEDVMGLLFSCEGQTFGCGQ